MGARLATRLAAEEAPLPSKRARNPRIITDWHRFTAHPGCFTESGDSGDDVVLNAKWSSTVEAQGIRSSLVMHP